MKILFILHIPPPVHGASVIGGLIKESSAINKSFECRYINYSISSSVEEIGHNATGKILRYISLVWNVQKQLVLFRPDICYFSPNSKGIGFYKDAVIILLVRLFGIRVVHHFHNKGVILRQNKYFDNILYKLVFNNADVILLSKHLYPDLRNYVPKNRVHYCPNGISDSKTDLTPSSKHERQFVAQSVQRSPGNIAICVQLLFISHLIESKGIFILIEALRLLHDKHLDFHCVMIGGEGDVSEAQLQTVVDNAGLTEKVLIAGKRFGAEKESQFEQADIFVHPTFSDCLPLVLLEAMKYRLPIVSTFEGAIPDVVEDGKTGFLVQQKDASALGDKLEILIKDSELRQKMGLAGRRKYEKEFILPVFEKRMLEILTKITVKE